VVLFALLLSGSIVLVRFGSVTSIQWQSSTKLGVVFHTPDREDYVVRAFSEIPVQPRQLPAGPPAARHAGESDCQPVRGSPAAPEVQVRMLERSVERRRVA
jgi:hypothetical protein